jgi:hypothetical protein
MTRSCSKAFFLLSISFTTGSETGQIHHSSIDPRRGIVATCENGWHHANGVDQLLVLLEYSRHRLVASIVPVFNFIAHFVHTPHRHFRFSRFVSFFFATRDEIVPREIRTFPRVPESHSSVSWFMWLFLFCPFLLFRGPRTVGLALCARFECSIRSQFVSLQMSAHNHDDETIITTLKILIIGESGVGKSRFLSLLLSLICVFTSIFSIMLRFVDDTFDPEQAATIGLSPPLYFNRMGAFSGVDFRVTSLAVEGNRVKLAIWVRSLAIDVKGRYVGHCRTRLVKSGFALSRPVIIAVLKASFAVGVFLSSRFRTFSRWKNCYFRVVCSLCI